MKKLFYRGPHQAHASEQSLCRLETFRKEVVTDAHTIPLEDLCSRLDTDPVSGLDEERAKDLLKRNGPNALTPSRKTPACIKFLKITFHGFSILLWVGAALCYGTVVLVYLTHNEVDTDNLVLGGSLVFVVLGTSIFMYAMERQSATVMESFENMVPAKATVIRNGKVSTINSRDLVLGDLVDIKFGDRVPADLRIVHARGLKVDNSPLTGESEAQSRGNTCTDPAFLETKNIVFFSTNVIEGTGRGIAVGCGDATVMGRIAGLTARLKANKTPMAKELDRFMKLISIWACVLGVLLGIACIVLQYKAIDTAVFVIGIIVANVPEATVTVCLTVTAKKMAAKNCVVKNLQAVETLGCTSVICSDKTGTLTQNRMTVAHVWFGGKACTSDLSDEQEEAEDYKHDAGFAVLARAACLCSRATFLPDQSETPILNRNVRGDASETAILKFIAISQVLDPDFAEKNPKLCEIPFSSSTKFQTSVHLLEDETVIVVMKGAPEVILERCSYIYFEEETVELNADLKNLCELTCLDFAAMGERVLGFGDLVLTEERFTADFEYSIEPPNFPQRHLRFLGFMAMIDPPRPQVPASIATCKLAGIRVTMVTGDHPVTAKAIAKQVGIITMDNVVDLTDVAMYRLTANDAEEPEAAMVIHGQVLKDLQSAELDDILYRQKEMVFARTSPTQKLQIVESYQRLGEIVAVTGDGVNDAPALKKADTGIAMGIAGTEVSQQAADIILMDDNFSTIILGIEEGRKIFDNLKKSIVYTLSSNVPEILPFVAFATLSIPLPMGIIAILAIDILTDMMPAISLAWEHAESDIMLRPPRNPLRDRLVSRKLYFLAYGNLGLIETAAGFLVYFVIMSEHGFYPSYLIGLRHDWADRDNNLLEDSVGRPWTYDQRQALEQTCYTGFLAAVVMCQWTNVIVCKTRRNSISSQGMRNWMLNASIIIETVLVCFLSYCPGMYYLKFRPLKIEWYACALPFALILFAFDELRKWHIRKYPKGWFQRETYY